MMIAVLYTLLFALCGVTLSEVVFRRHAFINRIWLGLTLGLLLLTWLPSLFAFCIGFSSTAQLLAGITAIVVLFASVAIVVIRKTHGTSNSYRFGRIVPLLLVAVPIIVLGAVLLHTHILYQHENGSIWVGQVTYGDLAMHLGFITSIAEQTTFPPQYSIFPGHALNYPFLCETSGATLYQLGASARYAYIISALYAFVLVVLGVYLFFKQWLKKDARAALATVLFFFGGGFGFFYFFDLEKSGGILTKLLGTQGQTVSQVLMDGFYQTPTNIPELGLRWVNPIVDMLIPQRATLFGWSFLFPCLYLLHGFAFEQKRENVIMLGVLAGALPLIHTHSFLALGIISAVYCITDLVSVRFERKRLFGWLLYALIACALAAPQLFGFSFRQASESSLVRLHLNWGNTTDAFIWFYVKNLGLLFLLMPFAFLLLSKRDRKIYAGVLVLWLIAEFIEFQPNDYDNNKLLFVWFAFTCALIAKWLCVIAHKSMTALKKRFTSEQIKSADRIGILALLAIFAVYDLCKLLQAGDAAIAIPSQTALTLFFLAGMLLAITARAMLRPHRIVKETICLAAALMFSCYRIVATIVLWYRQYRLSELTVPKGIAAIGLILCAIGILLFAIDRMLSDTGKRTSPALGALALSIAGYVLLFAMTASSVMTITRELNSEYQVYTAQEAELAEQIKEETEPDAVILANSYHWNLITPLTGRSIVTGTGTFLYYHGIDNSQRETDVRRMYEYPQDARSLFEQYHVRYILISNAERNSYRVDYDFLENECDVVVQNSSGTLYKLR